MDIIISKLFLVFIDKQSCIDFVTIKKIENSLNNTMNEFKKSLDDLLNNINDVSKNDVEKLLSSLNTNKLPIYVCKNKDIINPNECLYNLGFRVSYNQPKESIDKYNITMYSPYGEKLKFSTSKENNFSFYHIWLNMKSLTLKENLQNPDYIFNKTSVTNE